MRAGTAAPGCPGRAQLDRGLARFWVAQAFRPAITDFFMSGFSRWGPQGLEPSSLSAVIAALKRCATQKLLNLHCQHLGRMVVPAAIDLKRREGIRGPRLDFAVTIVCPAGI